MHSKALIQRHGESRYRDLLESAKSSRKAQRIGLYLKELLANWISTSFAMEPGRVEKLAA